MENLLKEILTPGNSLSLGALVFIAWRINKFLRKERAEERRDLAEESFRNSLIQQNKDLLARADAMSQQRDAALMRVSELEVENARLKATMAVLRGEKA